MDYEGYLSDRELISRDAFHKKQLKIKVLEINQNNRDYSKHGDRILIDKILLIIQNLETLNLLIIILFLVSNFFEFYQYFIVIIYLYF